MKVTVLDGALRDDAAAARVRDALADCAGRRGWDVTTFFLPDIDIAPCAGDFKCWFERPGMCAISGANRDIARSMAVANLAVFLTPVTFGGYSYHLKKALDHLAQNISPLFAMVNGEVHHQPRYETYPSLVAVGTERERDEDAEAVFAKLLARNAINMRAPGWTVMFATNDPRGDDVIARLDAAVMQVAGEAV